MARFTKMSRDKAPRPTRQTGRLKVRMQEYENYVSSLKKEETGRLEPDTGETPRGLALRISRAGKRLGVPIKTWVADGAVYFEA